MTEQNLKGRFAVVTGASSGIGWAVVCALLKEGVEVAGLARRLERMQELRDQLPTDQANLYKPIQCDLSSLPSIQLAFQQVSECFKQLHILVCNAGTMTDSMLLDTGNEAGLQQTMDVNLMGVVHSVKQAYPLLQKSLALDQPCHVVTVNSLLGHRVPAHIPENGFNLYPVSKHALRALHEVLRREFQIHKLLRLSNISPGLTNTSFAPDVLQTPDQILESEDVARGVLFILKSPPHVTVAELIMVPSSEHY